MATADDYRYMARALQLARRGLYTTDPNPRVGCVLVRDGEVVGEGWHRRAGEPHAEIHALRAAGERARGATAYVTLEPCAHHGRTPPCSEALVAAGVARVVAALRDPNPQVAGRGLQRLAEAGIETETGVLEAEAAALNPGFIRRMQRGRPWVRCKLAMSLDGRTAMASGESKWITGGPARQDVQRWRARSSAVMTGAGTVLADDPRLTARLDGVERQPLRVVIDGNLSVPQTARLFESEAPVLFVTASEDADAAEALRRRGAEVLQLPAGQGGVDLEGALQVNEILVEAGATLTGSLLAAGLADELILSYAPSLMGHQARPMFHLPALERLQDRVALEVDEVRAVGRDWRVRARPVAG